MGNENAIPDVLGTKKKKHQTIEPLSCCGLGVRSVEVLPAFSPRALNASFFKHLNVIVLLYGSGKETEYLIMADSLSVRSDVFEF